MSVLTNLENGSATSDLQSSRDRDSSMHDLREGRIKYEKIPRGYPLGFLRGNTAVDCISDAWELWRRSDHVLKAGNLSSMTTTKHLWK